MKFEMPRRWSLLNQILWPFLAIVLLAHLAMFWVTVSLATASKRREIEGRIAAVAQTLEQANFPITERVLRQMKGLSGAEFAALDSEGRVALSTIPVGQTSMPESNSSAQTGSMDFIRPATIGGKTYYLTTIRLAGRDAHTRTLRVYYPTEVYEQQRWGAVRPILIIGTVSALITAALATALSLRIARPIGQLKQQASQFSSGSFSPVSIPRRDDEIRDLAAAFNAMGGQLRAYENTIRQTERVRLLGMLRGGMVHQMRNSLMGARIALEVYQAKHPQAVADPGLQVVERQLNLMERYLKQLVEWGPGGQQRAWCEIRIDLLIAEVVNLVQPNAEHAGVVLEVCNSAPGIVFQGDVDGWEQSLLNLIINGIEAATERSRQLSDGGESGRVRIEIDQPSQGGLLLAVVDNGQGPPDGIGDSVFDPFVTSKTDGIGLGLAVVRQVAHDHGGDASWRREPGWTRFEIRIPRFDQAREGC